MKNKYYVFILIVIIFSFWILYILGKNLYLSEISKAYDTTMLVNLQEIKNNLKDKSLYNFDDLESYNKLFNTDLRIKSNCVYFKSIQEGKWFIFIFKVNYRKDIYWEYYIYKSIEDYALTKKDENYMNSLEWESCYR